MREAAVCSRSDISPAGAARHRSALCCDAISGCASRFENFNNIPRSIHASGADDETVHEDGGDADASTNPFSDSCAGSDKRHPSKRWECAPQHPGRAAIGPEERC